MPNVQYAKVINRVDKSNQLVIFQSARKFAVTGAKALQQGMEFGTVVHMLEMAELVEDDIVAKVLRKAHQIKVEIDVLLRRAAPPVGDIVLDRDPAIFESVGCGQLGHAAGEEGLGLRPEPRDFGCLGQGPPAPSYPPEQHAANIVKKREGSFSVHGHEKFVKALLLIFRIYIFAKET